MTFDARRHQITVIPANAGIQGRALAWRERSGFALKATKGRALTMQFCGDIRLALTLDDLYEDVDVPVI